MARPKHICCYLSTRKWCPQHSLSRTLVSEWAHGWLKEDKICEGSPLSCFWGFKGWPAGGRWLTNTLQPLTRHLQPATPAHLVRARSWIKILISRLAADTIWDTSVTTADFFFCLFGDDDHQLIMASLSGKLASCICHKTNTKDITGQVLQICTCWRQTTLPMETMMMRKDIGGWEWVGLMHQRHR